MNELDHYKKRQRDVLGEFLHELKTPLTIIRTHLESEIPNDNIPLDVRKKMVMDVEEVARLTTLISHMKTILSCEFEDEKIDFKTNSFLALLVDVIELLEPLADEKEIKVSFIAAQNIEYLFDHDKCKQLFYNLINNAIKYTPHGGKIDVLLAQDETSITIVIKDNGYGISKKDQQHIFKQFYRCNTNKGTIEGSGLGLTLCDAIATMHQAKIEVESQRDVGSTFKVIFKKTVIDSKEVLS
jgi:signal transduction histidine kinase